MKATTSYVIELCVSCMFVGDERNLILDKAGRVKNADLRVGKSKIDWMGIGT